MYAIQLIWLGIMIKSAFGGGGATKVVVKDEKDKNKKKQ
jgi:hypothetical protein